MFTVDEIVKLILAISVAFSIVVIAYQVARLLGESANLVKEVRKPVEDISQITDMVVDDYRKIRKILDILDNLKDVFGTATKFLSFMSDDEKDKDALPAE